MTLTVSVLLVIVAILQLSISLMVFLGGKKPRPPHQKLFVWLASALLLFMISSVVLLYADTNLNRQNLTAFNFVNSLAFLAGSAVFLLIYLFSHYYPKPKKMTTLSRAIISAGSLLILLSPFRVIAGYFSYTSKAAYHAGNLSPLVALYGLAVVISVFRHNIPVLRGNDRFLKQRVSTLLTGMSLTMVHALVFILILPLIFGDNVTLYAIGYFAPIYFIGFVGYSLLKQNLFNVRLVVARTVAYIFSLGLITAIFSLLIFGFSGAVLDSPFDQNLQRIFYVVTTLALVLTYPALKRFFDRVTNSVFYRDAYDTQELLDDLNARLVTKFELADLLEASAKTLSLYLKIDFCNFLIKSEDKGLELFGPQKIDIKQEDMPHIHQVLMHGMHSKVMLLQEADASNAQRQFLDDNSIMAIALLRSHHETIGYMLMGGKKSGGVYTEDDKRVIDIISEELAIAIQNSLRFEEIKRFNLTLQQKIDEATKQLRHANHRLKELDQTKDEFISMASHQLRTPLTTIKGYLSMVLEGDVGPVSKKEKDMIQHAFDGAERMVFLIGDLLNVSRLQSGKFVIENKPMDLAKMVGAEVTLLQETAKNHHLTLNYKKPEKFPLLSLDETKIRQVIMNFIDNAIFYTPAEGSIEVKLEADDKEVRFSVTDTGMGVPKEAQHHLFSKFYRAGNARKMRPDGTGLGLFMAKKVVVAQGGAIIFNSTEGKGSTFGFSLPRAKVEVRGKPSDERQPAALAA
jgi:signal transduction histidine kinase